MGRVRIAFEHGLDEEPGDPEADRDGASSGRPFGTAPGHKGRTYTQQRHGRLPSDHGEPPDSGISESLLRLFRNSR